MEEDGWKRKENTLSSTSTPVDSYLNKRKRDREEKLDQTSEKKAPKYKLKRFERNKLESADSDGANTAQKEPSDFSNGDASNSAYQTVKAQVRDSLPAQLGLQPEQKRLRQKSKVKSRQYEERVYDTAEAEFPRLDSTEHVRVDKFSFMNNKPKPTTQHHSKDNTKGRHSAPNTTSLLSLPTQQGPVFSASSHTFPAQGGLPGLLSTPFQLPPLLPNPPISSLVNNTHPHSTHSSFPHKGNHNALSAFGYPQSNYYQKGKEQREGRKQDRGEERERKGSESHVISLNPTRAHQPLRERENRGRGGGRPTPSSHSQQSQPSVSNSYRSIRVTNVPKEMNTIDKLNGHFKQFGSVVNIQIINNGAIIEYQEHSEAEAARNSTEAVFGNRFIRLDWQRPNPRHQQHANIQHHPENTNGSQRQNVAAAPNHQPSSQVYKPSAAEPKKSAIKPNPVTPSSLKAKQEQISSILKQLTMQQELLDQISKMKNLSGTERSQMISDVQTTMKKLSSTLDKLKVQPAQSGAAISQTSVAETGERTAEREIGWKERERRKLDQELEVIQKTKNITHHTDKNPSTAQSSQPSISEETQELQSHDDQKADDQDEQEQYQDQYQEEKVDGDGQDGDGQDGDGDGDGQEGQDGQEEKGFNPEDDVDVDYNVDDEDIGELGEYDESLDQI